MGADLAIVAEGLGKRFGNVVALADVDLEVAPGTTLGLLGPNGAGKTTAVRILATLLVPDTGRAWVHGLDVVDQAHAVRERIGLAGQYAAVDAYLTGRENLVMIGRLCGLDPRAVPRRADELIDQFDLVGAANRQVRTYSGGMRRRLDLAASLVGSPAVLFLDEPTSGLDPRGRTALWEILAECTAAGTTVLLTTQYLEEADRLADHVVIIDGGKVIAAGTSDQLKARLGGDRLELIAPPGDDPQRLADAVQGLGSGPAIIQTGGHVVMPVDNGTDVLAALAARLSNQGARITEASLRRPSLDDVFLSLTGHARPFDERGDNVDVAPQERG